MTTTVTVLVILLAAAIILTGRATPFNIIVLNIAPTSIGLASAAAQGTATWNSARLYTTGLVALIIGYIVTPRRTTKLPEPPIDGVISDAPVLAVVLFSGTLGIYHLAAVGFPVFSSEIETARFDFTSSGFFGIPGRMYLYGVPLAWALATAAAHQRSMRWRQYRPWQFATAFLALAALLSGFKSGVSALAIAVTLIAVTVTGRAPLIRSVLRRYWWAITAGLAYGLAVATQYGTYRSKGLPLWQSLVDRLTVQSIEPKLYALEGWTGVDLGNIYLHDLRYYLAKYTGNSVAGQFSFERAVSARIIGANPASDAWTVPVTVGGIPESIAAGGALLTFVLLLATGVLLRRVEGGHSGLVPAFVSASLVLWAYSWLLKGGLVYYTVNIAAVVGMLASVYATTAALGQASRAHRRPQRISPMRPRPPRIRAAK